jgi:phosphatidylinositol glycan class W
MVFFPTRTLKIRDPLDPSGKRLVIEEMRSESSAPALLEAINKNAFVLFLLVRLANTISPCIWHLTYVHIKANVTTGLINLNIQTMFVGNAKALGILCVYAIGMCAFAWLCRRKRIWKM